MKNKTALKDIQLFQGQTGFILNLNYELFLDNFDFIS